MSEPRSFALTVLGPACLGAVVLLLAGEGMVRLAGIEPPDTPPIGLAAMPGVDIDPRFGPLPRPGWSGAWSAGPAMGGRFRVEFDADGFRRAGANGPKADTARVAFLGDSCTFGWGVDTADTFVSRLAVIDREASTTSNGASRRRLELLNTGFPGHSAVFGAPWLRERILPLEPDLVVLGYSANNAFRLSLLSDAERLKRYERRGWLRRSRLLQVLTGYIATRRQDPQQKSGPRQSVWREPVPLEQIRRVARPDEFETAIATMVDDARANGARVIFLLFPRAMQVTDLDRSEDAAFSFRHAEAGKLEQRNFRLSLLETSCLDVRAEHFERLESYARGWHPVRPVEADARRRLDRGTEAYVRGDLPEAMRIFRAVLRSHPDSPLAHYDLGVAELRAGRTRQGLEHLERADALGCSAFLSYAVRAWRVALDRDVPVVDLAPWFQSQADQDLLLDAAHPTPKGHQLIAEALWPAIQKSIR